MHEEYDVALSKYKIAVQSEPTSVALWNNIGMCFYSKQKYVAVSIIVLIAFPYVRVSLCYGSLRACYG